jgi:hypothetical protein
MVQVRDSLVLDVLALRKEEGIVRLTGLLLVYRRILIAVDQEQRNLADVLQGS